MCVLVLALEFCNISNVHHWCVHLRTGFGLLLLAFPHYRIPNPTESKEGRKTEEFFNGDAHASFAIDNQFCQFLLLLLLSQPLPSCWQAAKGSLSMELHPKLIFECGNLKFENHKKVKSTFSGEGQKNLYHNRKYYLSGRRSSYLFVSQSAST